MLLILLLGLLALVQTQNNVCYANCKNGYCSPTNALNCTDCDSGLMGINGRCVSTNLQPVSIAISRTPSPT